MKLVGSRLRRDQHGRAGAFSPFRRVVVGEHLELLDGVDGREDGDAALIKLIVVVAIEHPIGTLGAGSTDGQRKRSARGSFAACRSVEETVGIGFGCRPGRKSCELYEVASI